MTHNDDFISQLESYLEDFEGNTPLPDTAREAIQAQLPTVRQRQSVWWPAWRSRQMNAAVKMTLAAATVLVVALAGIQLLARGGLDVGGQPTSPSHTPSADSTPGTSSATLGPTTDIVDQPFQGPDRLVGPSGAAVDGGELEAGVHTYFAVDQSLLNVQFAVPGRWDWDDGSLVMGSDGEWASISFMVADVQVYDDPCQWASGPSARPTGPGVGDLVTRLAAQLGRGSSGPVGRDPKMKTGESQWPGMAVELTVPADLDIATCDEGRFRTWSPDSRGSEPSAGQRDLVWAIDTDDERLIIHVVTHPDTPQAIRTQVDAILDSLRIGHWG